MRIFYFVFLMCLSHVAVAYTKYNYISLFTTDSVEIINTTINNEDSIPIAFFNEKEISYEEYTHLPQFLIGTNVFLDGKRAMELIGDRGKNGLLYVSTKKDKEMDYHLLNDDTYYFKECDFHAEFPGGTNGLLNYLSGKRYIPDDMERLYVAVYLNCYIDRDGTLEKAEVTKILFEYPENVQVLFRKGKMAQSDIISPKYREYIKYFRERALLLANNFPKFIPAKTWFSNVKSIVEIPIGFYKKGHYDNIQYEY